MKSFTKDINNRLNYIKDLNKFRIGYEFEFYSNMSYYKTLESLNQYLSPVKVHGFRKYHSKFKPDSNNFKLEPDYSGGADMVELVTGPIRYQESRIYLTKVLKWMQENTRTDERCSIHINIGFPEKSQFKLENLNILKLILNINEHKILKEFPDRKHNIYSKSVAKLIPFKNYDFTDVSPSIIASSLNLPSTKYFGINLNHLTEGRIEWRYLGGKDYQFKVGQILDAMDYFIFLTSDSLFDNFNNHDYELLQEYLDKNISEYKTLAEIDDFISLYPTIELQVDKKPLYETLSTYYYRFFDKLYDLISNTENLKECIINWDTLRNRLEVVNADVKSTFLLEGYDFINCVIKDSTLLQCETYTCEVHNTHIDNSIIQSTEIFESKLTNCRVDQFSLIVESYFTEGILDGEIKGGVLRSGILGKNAVISSTTRILTEDNFFNIKKGQVVSKKGNKKGTIIKK